jgi:hypothetical protein
MRFVLACLILASAAAQPSTPDPLYDSDIYYMESGGLAGRVREARLTARGGTVTVEYRPGDAYPSAPAEKGTMEPARYLELWRRAEKADVWSIKPAGKSRGMDLVTHELEIRIEEKSHTIRWDDGQPESEPIRRAAGFGREVLSAARKAATEH